ncbi:MAG: LysR family transcriptional regulator [Alphaproteobacteria bacterium]|jgi:molybdate transport system regulatory protein
MTKADKNPGVRTKLFVANETIGIGKIKLLQLVGETGSISAAARQMGMNYRRAWFLIDSMQSGFADPLLLTERGGKARGGASLTPLATELINRYEAHASLIADQSSDILDWLRSVQSEWSPDADVVDQKGEA